MDTPGLFWLNVNERHRMVPRDAGEQE